MPDAHSWIFAALGVLFIGLSKAGFGGGLGMLTTPLCALAFGPKAGVGILLPLLCAGDAFSMYHFWGKWEQRNLRFLLPGVALGVVIGVQLIDLFSTRQFNVVIGLLAGTVAGVIAGVMGGGLMAAIGPSVVNMNRGMGLPPETMAQLESQLGNPLMAFGQSFCTSVVLGPMLEIGRAHV